MPEMSVVSDKDNFLLEDVEDYESNFDDDEEKIIKQDKRKELATSSSKISNVPTNKVASGLPSKTFFDDEHRRAEGYKNRYLSLNAFERHKKLVNDYLLYFPGAKNLLKRDSSKDKTDIDIIRENHRFLWQDDDDVNTWEKELAKKYYDKLFKEYCICDLSRFRENKIAMRWRVEKELIDGKGQFICGEKSCPIKESLKTWEVNFAYLEDGSKKNALVKLRLCPECSIKLNFHHQRKEILKKPKKRKSSNSSSRDRLSIEKKKRKESIENTEESEECEEKSKEENIEKKSESIWKEPVIAPELKSREDEFEDYLDDLFM